ncbi:hypothetical protein K0M31_019757, partial [Melipona bicolor]
MHTHAHAHPFHLAEPESIRSRSHELNPAGGGEAASGGKTKEREKVALATTEGFSMLVARATSNRRSLNMRQQARSGAKEEGEKR